MRDNQSLKLLVIEDESIQQEIVADTLSGGEPRFELSFANNCSEAIAALDLDVFDCVLLDHNLPDGTGADLVRQAQYQLVTTPVVAFSTSDDPDVALADFHAGCSKFISKHEAFRGDHLRQVLIEAIEEYAARAQVERASGSMSLIKQAGELIRDSDTSIQSVQDEIQLIYETAVQVVDEGIMLIKDRHQVLFANNGLKKLIGLKATEHLPGHPHATIRSVFTEASAELFEEAFDVKQQEASLLSAEGNNIPVLVTETKLNDNAVICTVTDLSTIKAQRQQLEEKNRRLSELNETANRFVDNVSHEFRTPLTVIGGYTEAILKGLAGAVNDEQEDFLKTVLDRTKDLAQMVDDLLDTSKLRAGSLRVDRCPCYVRAILDRVRPSIKQKAEANQVAIVEDLVENLPQVYADAEKISRVILNLIVNAIKFSDEGSKVTISGRLHDDGDVWISVTDNGPGISPENLKLIFDRFKQVGDPQRSSTKGFGLGLNISNELVAMNLGQMHVDSQLGQGSTFGFTLPPNDTQKVIARLLEHLSSCNDGVVHVSALRLSGLDDSLPLDRLRELAISYSRPMDMVFGSTQGGSLLLIGETSQPQRWADQLQQSLVSGAGRPAESFQFQTIGQWVLPDHRLSLLSTLEGLIKEE